MNKKLFYCKKRNKALQPNYIMLCDVVRHVSSCADE